jgi:hypothetical protein
LYAAMGRWVRPKLKDLHIGLLLFFKGMWDVCALWREV